MDKMYYNDTDTAHVLISGPPSTPVNLSVIDSSYQQKLANIVQLDPNGTGTFSFNLTSFSDGIYTAIIGQGYGSVKIGFGVGIMPTGPQINVHTSKSSFVLGELIQVLGSWRPGSITNVDLKDPYGTVENSTDVTSDHSGNFMTTFQVPQNAINGTWKIDATSGEYHTTISIVVNSSSSIPPIPYSILRSAVPTLTPSENQTVVSIALSVPGLQNWSHDWQYVSTGFLSNNKLATVGFEWQYAMVDLKAPSSSAPVPCDQGWEAEVTVDMTTMKVVSADYPTMESHNCDNYVTGGGPNTSEISPTIESPLKQFESGVSLDDITCKDGFFLAISIEKNPLCLKAGTISKLATRGFLYGINANETEMNYTTVLIPPGSENQASKNHYSPDIVNVVIGVNNTVRWVSQSDVGNTIVPDQPVEQSGKSFGSPGIIPPGKSYQFTFTQPGTYPYHTEPHPWMTGQVIVSQVETQASSQPSTEPIAPCQTPFEKNTTLIQVLYMPMDSTGMICIQYSNQNQNPVPVGINILESKNLTQQASGITIHANATSIMSGNSTVVYTVQTGQQAGFYQLSVFCSGMPFAVGYDNQSRIVAGDFPWLYQTVYCPLSPYDFKVVGLSGIGVKYIP